ncbi:hypothetical protein [Niabella hibiscisoli]|uniref:hypothetical protein n=1 Tax=Niabella hibiscisoli TaxID=1825928 RepID=UPI001F1091CE|nr:hypothetical protein [Niabella hibiscisoli]MCH5718978.1 hypothetical protein [Niabella hibiscisoli]
MNARYFRITAAEMYDDHTSGLVFSEIDVYNAQTSSGDMATPVTQTVLPWQ